MIQRLETVISLGNCYFSRSYCESRVIIY